MLAGNMHVFTRNCHPGYASFALGLEDCCPPVIHLSWWQGFDEGVQRCRLEEAGDGAGDTEAYSHKQERMEHGFS
jgi:hypothetical protein